MKNKRILVFLFILMLLTFSASAGDVSLNRWVINVSFDNAGSVDQIIQAEIENGGSLPLDGFSIVIPASKITVLYDFDHTFSSKGQVVEQQTVAEGIRLKVIFNTSIAAGEKWNGRIGFIADNWAKRTGEEYSIDIPLEVPQVIISGKNTAASIPQDMDMRCQVFLPKGVEVTSVTPKPFRILLQFGKMVPTWSSQNLKTGDTINLKGTFSTVLNKIVETDDKIREVKKNINSVKSQGIDVSEADVHLKKAEDFNTNQATQSYWKQDYTVALEFNGYANDELNLAEKSISGKGNTPTAPKETMDEKKTPGFGAIPLVLIIISIFIFTGKKGQR